MVCVVGINHTKSSYRPSARLIKGRRTIEAIGEVLVKMGEVTPSQTDLPIKLGSASVQLRSNSSWTILTFGF